MKYEYEKSQGRKIWSSFSKISVVTFASFSSHLHFYFIIEINVNYNDCKVKSGLLPPPHLFTPGAARWHPCKPNRGAPSAPRSPQKTQRVHTGGDRCLPQAVDAVCRAHTNTVPVHKHGGACRRDCLWNTPTQADVNTPLKCTKALSHWVTLKQEFRIHPSSSIHQVRGRDTLPTPSTPRGSLVCTWRVIAYFSRPYVVLSCSFLMLWSCGIWGMGV